MCKTFVFSDVIVQIVDARNPLLFYCDDLSKYVGSKGKVNALLINKADLLSEAQRYSLILNRK